MTSKKGSLWKTSWNRGRGTPAPPKSGDMSFFLNFAEKDVVGSAVYLGSVPATLAAGLPCWFGIVGIGPEPNKGFSAGPGFDNALPYSTINSLLSTAGVGGLPLLGAGEAAPATAPFSYVCPALYIVRPVDAGFSVRMILSKGLATSYDVSEDAFTPASFPVRFAPNTGGLHGLAGGPFDLTQAEIDYWFDELKSTLIIPPIPGKTSNLYSADSVVGTVPAVLPNLGSAGAAQNLDYTVISGAPSPTNELLPAYFTY